MSADFWSFALPVPSDFPLESLRRYEVLDDVLGPDEETLHRFIEGGADVDLCAIAEAFPDGFDGPEQPAVMLGTAYLDLPFEVLEGLPGFAELNPSASPNYASFVAIDRAIALPMGFALLCGRALRLVSVDALEELNSNLESVIQARGEDDVFATLSRHLERWGNGDSDARQAWHTLRLGVLNAIEANEALLLVACVVP